MNKLTLYYCNVVIILYIITLLLIRKGWISLDSPFSLAMYILTWAIPLIGVPLVFYIGNRIKKMTNKRNDKLFYFILLTHVGIILPLLYFVPYRNKTITVEVVSKTITFMVTIVVLYYLNVRLRGYTLKELYKL